MLEITEVAATACCRVLGMHYQETCRPTIHKTVCQITKTYTTILI